MLCCGFADVVVGPSFSALGMLGDFEEISVRVGHLEERLSAPIRKQRKRLTKEERVFIWSQSGGRCYLCKDELPKLGSWHVEHILAFSKDPQRHDVLGNMLAACASCNLRKHSKSLEEVIRAFASNLDSAAAHASHLLTEPRLCLLNALKLKRELFGATLTMPQLDAALDEIQDQALSGSDCEIDPGEIEMDEEQNGVGKGTFGDVFQASWGRRSDNFATRSNAPGEAPASMKVAIKFARDPEHTAAVVQRERQALTATAVMSGGHPNIVRYHGFVRYRWTTGQEQMGLVMEWCDFDMGHRSVYRRGNLVELMAQAADGLAFIHSLGFIHRDVKPSNILVKVVVNVVGHWESVVAKLADFGTAKRIHAEEALGEHTNNQGTAFFRAPGAKVGKYCAGTDVYCLGRSMAHMKREASLSNALFRAQSQKLKGWDKVQAACCKGVLNFDALSSLPSAGEVRDQLRALLPPVAMQSNVLAPGEVAANITAAAPEEAVEVQEVVVDTVGGGSGGIEGITDQLAVVNVADDLVNPVDVYVNVNARTDDAQTGKKWGMSYHQRGGCSGANSRVSLEVAEQFRHKPCKHCATA
mmetsp:Transcript_38078/g.94435  ORF Transcript_38078/g.94435 Transcript_38078/m.94435 type:complete len:585 (+) Transcript_38078:80-1834(+)